MAKAARFAFPKQALGFLAGLSRNNNKAWFEAHRAEYEEHLLENLRVLVVGLGAAMARKLPGLHYEPRVNGSIFRIYRDTRFSKNKQPYKTHAGVFLWVGPGPKLACPGIYFHLEADTLLLGSGVYRFADSSIDTYRKYVASKGAALAKSIAKAEKAGFKLDGEALKRVPSGYPTDHKYAGLLKMKGLHVGKKYKAARVTKGDVIGWLKKEYEPALDLVKTMQKALF